MAAPGYDLSGLPGPAGVGKDTEMLWQPGQTGELDLDGLQVSPQGTRALRASLVAAPSSPLFPCVVQNYFNQAGPSSALNDPLLMQTQAPFRNGGLAGLPGAYNVPPPSANLFSSIVLPDAGAGIGGGAGGSRGGGGGLDDDDDSGDSSGGGMQSGGGKRSAEQRAAAVQEKNRRAQKRFRERQVSVANGRRAVDSCTVGVPQVPCPVGSSAPTRQQPASCTPGTAGSSAALAGQSASCHCNYRPTDNPDPLCNPAPHCAAVRGPH